MSDLISREELLNKITRQPIHYIGGVKGYLEIENIINNMPSIDAQPIVRCKDCKHTTKSSADKMFVGKLHCRFTGICVDDDFFCRWGEKE